MYKDGTLIKKIGVTPEQIIGYVYAGMLAALYSAIIIPDKVKIFVETLGGLLATFAFMSIGIGIFILYHRVFGEWFIYLLHHWVHNFVDRIRGLTQRRHTSSTSYLAFLGVPFGQRRAAYESIKTFFYIDDKRLQIQLSHGEIHVLYLTALESIIAAIYASNKAPNLVLPFSLIALVFYLGGLSSDIRQHSIETYLLKAIGEEKVLTFLEDVGYIDKKLILTKK